MNWGWIVAGILTLIVIAGLIAYLWFMWKLTFRG